MKKKCPFCSLFVSGFLVLASCDTHSAVSHSFSEGETIRHEARMAAGSLTWTGAAENDAPAENIPEEPDRFSEQLALSFGPKTTMVYPELPGFGSLDTTEITPAIRESLTVFLSSLEQDIVLRDSFDPSYAFSAVVTQYQIDSGHLHFSDFIIGKPYIAHNEESPLYELPVLAKGSSTTCILRIYLNPVAAENNLFQIQQISIEEQPHD